LIQLARARETTPLCFLFHSWVDSCSRLPHRPSEFRWATSHERKWQSGAKRKRRRSGWFRSHLRLPQPQPVLPRPLDWRRLFLPPFVQLIKCAVEKADAEPTGEPGRAGKKNRRGESPWFPAWTSVPGNHAGSNNIKISAAVALELKSPAELVIAVAQFSTTALRICRPSQCRKSRLIGKSY